MRRQLPSVSFVIISCLSLIWPAIYNGFPLVYSDSGSYMDSSLTLEVSMYRPLFYGVFLHITAMKEHLWISIIGQGLISGWILLELLKTILPESGWIVRYVILVLLSVFTGMAWYTSQLMPDFFTPLTIVVVYLLLADKTASRRKRLLYFFALFAFTGMHLSNLLIVGLVTVFIACIYFKKVWYNSDFFRARIIGIVVVLLVTGLTHALSTYSHFGVFTMSRGSNLFLAAKCMETPLFKTYMRENPNKIDIPFSDQIDSMPDGACAFLWGTDSPLNQPGVDPVKTSAAYGPVLKDMLSQSRYRNWFIQEAFSATWKQLQLHKVGSGLLSYPPPSAPAQVIQYSFKSGFPAYLKARQQHENLEDNYLKHLSGPIYYGSLLIIFGALFFSQIRKQYGLLILAVLIGVVANAFVTAALANVYDRLQTRVLWLVTFLAIVMLIQIWKAISRPSIES